MPPPPPPVPAADGSSRSDPPAADPSGANRKTKEDLHYILIGEGNREGEGEGGTSGLAVSATDESGGRPEQHGGPCRDPEEFRRRHRGGGGRGRLADEDADGAAASSASSSAPHGKG